MKRTCSGCIALDVEGHCELTHPIRTTGTWPNFRYHPTEECEKPMTIKAYLIAWRKHFPPRPTEEVTK